MTTFYERFVTEMFKDREEDPANAAEFLSRFGTIHAAVGIAGEAGEVLDLIKKSVFTGKNMYIDEIIKELGDLEFYLEALRQQLHLTRDEILQANWQKLSQRHGNNDVEEYYQDDRQYTAPKEH